MNINQIEISKTLPFSNDKLTIHEAAFNGVVDVVCKFIKENPEKINETIELKGESGISRTVTPICLAAISGNHIIVKKLLDAKAVQSEDLIRWAGHSFQIKLRYVIFCLLAKNVQDIASKLSIVSREDFDSFKREGDELRKLLIANGFVKNMQLNSAQLIQVYCSLIGAINDPETVTTIMGACKDTYVLQCILIGACNHNKGEIIDLLVNHFGLDLNVPIPTGPAQQISPGFVAVTSGHLNIIQKFQEHKFNFTVRITTPTWQGLTLADIAVEYKQSEVAKFLEPLVVEQEPVMEDVILEPQEYAELPRKRIHNGSESTEEAPKRIKIVPETPQTIKN